MDKSKIPNKKGLYIPRPGYNKLTGWSIDRAFPSGEKWTNKKRTLSKTLTSQ